MKEKINKFVLNPMLYILIGSTFKYKYCVNRMSSQGKLYVIMPYNCFDNVTLFNLIRGYSNM